MDHVVQHRPRQRTRPYNHALLLLTLVTTISLSDAAGAPRQFHIGYQKAANTLVLLKARGDLDRRLRTLDVEVTWLEFTAGPQLLEGLNVGSVDFGYVGEVPPIFALAAGANFGRFGIRSLSRLKGSWGLGFLPTRKGS